MEEIKELMQLVADGKVNSKSPLLIDGDRVYWGMEDENGEWQEKLTFEKEYLLDDLLNYLKVYHEYI